MSKIIYIAGPMTGLPDFNWMAFYDAEKELRETELVSTAIINPRANFGGVEHLDYAQYMRMSIHQLLCADAIYMLRGWENSTGARFELSMARMLGLVVMFEDGAAFDS